jgi:hypothetical protein
MARLKVVDGKAQLDAALAQVLELEGQVGEGWNVQKGQVPALIGGWCLMGAGLLVPSRLC